MRNNRLMKNTFWLILGGFITKTIGFIIRILYTRYLKEEGVALISLVFPTYTLLLTISSFALPVTVTKLIAQNKIRKSKILFNSFWITTFINTLIIIVFLILSNEFSEIFLHNKNCSYLIKILIFSLPFVSTTSLIKAYFYGIENVKPIIISNISEEIIKLVSIILFLPKFVSKSIMYGTSFYISIILVCEIISFLILSRFIPKKLELYKLDYRFNYGFSNILLKMSTPILSGRLIGSIGYFLEPIILTNLLIFKGINKEYIILNYGYFQGYVIALLIMPSFFINALSNNMLPVISKYKNNIITIKKIISKIILLITFGGIIFLNVLFIFGNKIMMTLYNTNSGLTYLKILTPFFILFYFENPLLTTLQALDQERNVFKITTYGIIFKYISLIILILLNFGFISLIYSEILNIIFVISLSIYYLRKYFCYFSQ